MFKTESTATSASTTPYGTKQSTKRPLSAPNFMPSKFSQKSQVELAKNQSPYLT